MIDIIIPFYNVDRKALACCIKGLENQTIIDKCNVCIISDNSPVEDMVFEMFKESRIPFVQFLRLAQNSGPGIARNFGLDNTKEPFIYCHDADDWFYEQDILEKLLKIALENPEYHAIRGKELLSQEQNFGDMGHNRLYRRDFIDKNQIRFGPMRTHEDLYFEECQLMTEDYKTLSVDLGGYYYNNVGVTNYIPEQVNITSYWAYIFLYLRALELGVKERRYEMLLTFFTWKTDRDIDYEEVLINAYFIYCILMEDPKARIDIETLNSEQYEDEVVSFMIKNYRSENYNIWFHGIKFSNNKNEFFRKMRDRILNHENYQSISLSARNKLLSYIPQKYLF